MSGPSGGATHYPNLFLVGPPKCGTTSMAYCLAQHPDIFAPYVKEPFFFGNDFTRANPPDPKFYVRAFQQWKVEPYALDATPHYIYSKTAAAEIQEVSPNARIVVMVRNPIEACYSLFKENRYIGVEPLNAFEKSLLEEPERAKITVVPKHGINEQLLYSRIYAFRDNINRYQEKFEAKQMHVVLLDDFSREPYFVLEKIWTFLSVPCMHVAVEQKNLGNKHSLSKSVRRFAAMPPWWAGMASGFIPKSWRLEMRGWLLRANTVKVRHPPMSRRARQILTEQFRPEVEWLSGYLHRDLSHWLKIDA